MMIYSVHVEAIVPSHIFVADGVDKFDHCNTG